MSDDYADLLGDLDGPNASYPPFDQLSPYPKFLVIDLYGGYILDSGKWICITQPDQMFLARRLQTILAQIGINWEIKTHDSNAGRENIGVQFEIKPLSYGADAYEIGIETEGIISLFATNLSSLERGVNTLIQVIQLAFEEFGEGIASLWIRDWVDTSQGMT